MKAEESDWKLISDIYASCTEWLSKQGMRHWENVSYRNSQERLTQRIREKDVYVLFFDEKAVGTITLSYQAPPYFKGYSFWEDSSASAVYISKLAVLPDYHERGFGSELLQFAEDKARHKGIHYVRFDAIASYKKLNDFYSKRGYKIVGKAFSETSKVISLKNH
jgi:GNAT superfamily N-acetyltransferase